MAMGGFGEVRSPANRFTVHFPVSGDAAMELAEETGIFLDRVEAKLIAMGVNTARRTSRIDVDRSETARSRFRLRTGIPRRKVEAVPMASRC